MGRGGGDAEMSGCAQPDAWCHLLLAHKWSLMARVRCQRTQTCPGEYSVTSTWPGRFAGVAAPEHSCAVTNSSTCCDVPPWLLMSLLGSPSPSMVPTTSHWAPGAPFYRTPMMPRQYESPPSADLTPHPAGQFSSPAHG